MKRFFSLLIMRWSSLVYRSFHFILLFFFLVPGAHAQFIGSEADSLSISKRLSIQAAWVAVSFPEHSTTSSFFLVAGFGLVPQSAWIPDPHVYLWYGGTSFEQFSGLTGRSIAFGKTRAFGIYPVTSATTS